MIFETERLIVRKLTALDVNFFHILESNPNVLKYAEGDVKTLYENKEELITLIEKYDKKENDFWIYAIENKENQQFMGTIAMVKDGFDDEIGYRFIEEYWGNDYGFEICNGIISYAKAIGLNKIGGYVVQKNVASLKILEKLGFKKIESFVNKKFQKEIKYELVL